ncbi:MAG: hypothetical protein ACOX6Y_01240 [Christensenellales bacterium]
MDKSVDIIGFLDCLPSDFLSKFGHNNSGFRQHIYHVVLIMQLYLKNHNGNDKIGRWIIAMFFENLAQI